MQDNFNLYNVQKAIGYTFKDPSLIKTAFVCHTKKSDVQSNEGLVFHFVVEKQISHLAKRLFRLTVNHCKVGFAVIP